MLSLRLLLTNSNQMSNSPATFSRIHVGSCNSIVDNFDIKFSVDLCTVYEDPELPRIRVFGTLPAFKLAVSPHSIKTLQQILNTITMQSATVERTKHNTFSNSVSLPLEMIPPDDQNAADVEAAFSVNDFSLVIKDDTEHDLVVLSLENLSTHAILRRHDLDVDVVLQSFCIKDCLQSSPEFAFLAQSQGDSKIPLIKVCYSKIQKVPYDHYDTNPSRNRLNTVMWIPSFMPDLILCTSCSTERL